MQRILAAISLSLVLTTGCTSGVRLYVAPNGNDAWTGRTPDPAGGEKGPFASLERARDEIRKLRNSQSPPTGPVHVCIRGGTYTLEHPLELKPSDSGTEASPVCYMAFGRETPRIIAGREVTNFKPVTDDAILSRLEPAARGHVLAADVKSLGIADFGTVQPEGNRFELFFDGKPMTLARWPNEGYTKTGELLGGKPVAIHGRKGDAIGQFTYEGDRPSRWKDDKDIWLSGYWFWDWADEYERLESVDTAKRVINVKPPYHGYGYRKGQRYYVLNLLSEIDSPGEWYLDRQTGMLFFWPPSDIAAGKAFVSVLPSVISTKDASYVTFTGLTLEFSRNTTITVQGGCNVRVTGCTIRNVGGKAVQISGGGHHAIIGCDVYDTGDGGISIDGGDRPKLIPANHLALNNHVYRYSRNSKTYRPGINVGGIGNRVAHNLIHDAPHIGILFGGNDHLIEFNEVYGVCTETDDAGAVYTGRDWTYRGNRIQYNYFHHMGDYNTGVGVMSVYLDDFTSATTIYGNVFYKGGRAVLLGGGRDNVVDNNIFVDCSPSVHVDSRGLGWAKPWFNEPNNSMRQALQAMPYKQPPWSTRYPELLTLLDDEPALAKYNVLTHNIHVGKGKWLELLDKLTDKIVKVENNLAQGDPKFVDAGRADFRLQADSPAWKLGFKPIPFDKIGLYRDSLRASWPPPPAPR